MLVCRRQILMIADLHLPGSAKKQEAARVSPWATKDALDSQATNKGLLASVPSRTFKVIASLELHYRIKIYHI